MIEEEHRDEQGRYHRVGGPAVIKRLASGMQYEHTWYRNGVKHREDGPAEICFWTGLKIWYYNGQIHRDNGPAIIKEFDSKREERWYQRGRIHRVDGPAKIWWKNGRLLNEQWFTRGSHHRHGAPAIIRYRADGTISGALWYAYGKLHRVDGPAIDAMAYGELRVGWFIRGRKLPRAEVNTMVARFTNTINAALPLPIAEAVLEEYTVCS